MIGVLGATGTTGSLLVQRLNEQGLPTRALAHHAEAAEVTEKLRLPHVEVRVGDYENDDDLRAFLTGLGQLFLLTVLQENQTEVQNHIIDVAAGIGVGAITKLSVWTSAEDSPLAISRSHHAIEQHLAESGLPYTILQPHTFMQTLGATFGEEVRVASSISSSFVANVGTYMVDARDAADVAAEVLARNEHNGETLVIHGPEALSYADCARLVGERLGREVTYNEISSEEIAARFRAAGMSEFYIDIFVTLFAMYSAGKYEPPLNTTTQEWTGHEPRTFSDFLDENLAMFQ
jgi:uncharacterized protein YbjT (DUF2867 family)